MRESRPDLPTIGWTVGISLGSDDQETSLAVVQHVRPRGHDPLFDLLWLDVWRQHPHALVPRLQSLWHALGERAHRGRGHTPVPPAIALLADVTAVGSGGLDPLRRAGFAPIGIVVHDGHSVERTDGLTWVPWLRLGATLRRVLIESRLSVSGALPDPERLRRALGTFRVPLGLEETTVAAWRDEADTGLVVALGVAVWAAEAGATPAAVLVGAHRILWQRDHGGGVYQA